MLKTFFKAMSDSFFFSCFYIKFEHGLNHIQKQTSKSYAFLQKMESFEKKTVINDNKMMKRNGEIQ